MSITVYLINPLQKQYMQTAHIYTHLYYLYLQSYITAFLNKEQI